MAPPMAVTRGQFASTEIVDLAAIRQAQHQAEEKARPAAYSPTTSLEKIARDGRTPDEVHKLDWNEGTIAPPPSVTAAMMDYIQSAGGAYLKWYPHLSGGEALRLELASYCGVEDANLLVTNGSDDALILLCRALLAPGKVAVAPTPTYEHFCVNVAHTGAELVRVDLSDPFVVDVDAVATAVEHQRPAMVYLVSPNNPTGIEWPVESVRDLATRFPEVMFLVDEAYHEFGTPDGWTGEPRSCARLAATLRNVVVTRTFSKAFCLASVRCGYVVAHPSTIEDLRAYYNPKSVNQFAQVAAVAALRELDTYYKPYIAATRAARDAFVRDLQARGIAVRTGGAGNFVCLYLADGRTAELCRRLEAHAIYVRDLGARFPGHVRITIGLDMGKIADAIEATLHDMGHLTLAP